MRNLCFAILLAIGVTGCEPAKSTDESSPPQPAEPTASTPAPKDSVPVYRVRVDSDDSTSRLDESSLLRNIAETGGTPPLTKEDVEKLKDVVPCAGNPTVIIIDDSMSTSLSDTDSEPTTQP